MEVRPRIGSWTACAVVVLLGFLSVTRGQDTLRKTLPHPPLLSQYDSTESVRHLQRQLAALFANRTYQRSKVSICVRSLNRNVVLYEQNPLVCLTPASTSKLFCTAAAFHALGSNGTIDTEVRATGKLDANGTLHGDLFLVGHGDALLHITDIEELADAVSDAGIRSVTGHVYGDGTFFDANTDRAIYSGDNEQVQPLAPITALGVNKNTVAVVVSTSSKGVVSAQTLPQSDAVDLRKRAVVVRKSTPSKSKRGKSTKKRTDMLSDPFAVPQLYGDSQIEYTYTAARPKKKKYRRTKSRRRQPRVSVSSTVDATGKQILSYSGVPSRGRTATAFISVSNPATFAAGALSHRLRSGGVDVSDSVGSRRAPASSRVIATYRRPLQSIASVVNKRSDNYLAEHIFKLVGGLYGGQTNTANTARSMILTTLDSLRVPRNGCIMNDGSGLSRRNAVCARTEADLLTAIHGSRYASEFLSTLSIASVDGTLRGRMHGTPAAGNVRGKTGSLRNTSALAGYVTTLDGERLVFSVISNGPYTHTFKATENKVCVLLATFSYDQRKVIEPIKLQPKEEEVDTTSADPEEEPTEE